MPASAARRLTPLLSVGLLLLAACLPLLSLVGQGPGFLVHPGSELPVRLWVIHTFRGMNLFGGMVPMVGYPHAGALNNPDPFGTLFVPLFQPLLGQAGAWNLMVVLILWANMLATWALVRDWLEDEVAAVVGALGVGLAPVLLSYCLMSSIVDLLHVWPYPLALLAWRRAVRGGQPLRGGALSGLVAALGCVWCPYAFVVAVSAVPVGLALEWRRVLAALRAPVARRAWLRAFLGAAVVGGLIVGLYGLQLRSIMHAPGSQMSADFVALSRNTPPWAALHAQHPGQFQAYLWEYLAMGRGALMERDTASHYARTMDLTVVLLGLGLLGAWKGRANGTRSWLLLALFMALASTGPFLCLGGTVELPWPVNPFFHYVYWVAPQGRIILETFRYGVVTAFAVAMAAAGGVAWLRARGGLGRRLAPLVPLAYVLELLFLSPLPVPLPVAHPVVGQAYAHLDQVLPPGPILELPFSDGDTGRFSRIHFFNQTVHGRPIADEVRGWPPDLLLTNAFLRTLVSAEGIEGRFHVDGSPRTEPMPRPEDRLRQRYRRLPVSEPSPRELPAARRELIAEGFVGVVINPAAYSYRECLDRVLSVLGPGVVRVDDRLVYRLQ